MKLKNYFFAWVIVTLVSFNFSKAQTIVNGAFENWTITNYDEPDNWNTANSELNRGGGIVTVTKVTGRSNFAIKLETKVSGGDTSFAYFSNTEGDPEAGEGGVPYTQKPDSITGYYQYNVASGDTALLLVLFKKNGSIVSADLFKVTGTQSSFTRFAYPLSLSVTPDTVIIAAASSNAIDNIGVKPGSIITFDDLAFVGTGITQVIPNGNFNSWSAKSYDEANNWSRAGSGVSRTTDSYRGSYAVLLETKDVFDGDANPSAICNGTFGDNGPEGGVPYTRTQDTLVFYYKYIPQGSSTGAVSVSLFAAGSPVGGQFVPIAAASSYTKMEVPFQAGNTPDTIRIVFLSSDFPVVVANMGTKLYVDEVQLKSQPLNTGIKPVVVFHNSINLYPNPATTDISISIDAVNSSKALLIVSDVLGRDILLKDVNIEIGTNIFSTSVNQLPGGVYYCRLVNSLGQQIAASQKFVKE